MKAGNIFNLSDNEVEKLVNKAGFTLKRSDNYYTYLNKLIHLSSKKNKSIYYEALISERMYRFIKSGYIPTKPSILAIAVALGLKADEIYLLLQKAGYVLSESIGFDMVVKYLIENPQIPNNVLYINDILYELDLPLLMTRGK